ncbi:MAG TPA: hypothetical protein P5216_00895, partial [Bacteroidota bacterium]|nr:hypothetical protein [Bacteroidota bacterium]
MKLSIQSPLASLNKTYLKQKVLKDDILKFKNNLNSFFNNINEEESEDNQKNHIRDFLLETHYKGKNDINTKDKIDLAIFLDNKKIGVIFEVKKPLNKSEMISQSQPNAKALHELILYYLQQRTLENNDEIKYLIATNLYSWYIFDAVDFEKLFYNNKAFLQKFKNWNSDQLVSSVTDHFYYEIAKPYLDTIQEIPCTYFDVWDFTPIFQNPNFDFSENSLYNQANNESIQDLKIVQEFIALYKLLSPFHLLKQSYANDSNALDLSFYRELLYIMGLEEAKEQNRIIIRRCQKNRQPGSLIENIYNKLNNDESIRNKIYENANADNNSDENISDPIFDVALQLCMTWINRILFLKLLEGQLVAFNKNYATDYNFRFLTTNFIQDYDDLNELFFDVLAVPYEMRDTDFREKFSSIPYLNSSLFEKTEDERNYIEINQLKNTRQIAYYPQTILKNENGTRQTGTTIGLDYLFKFLDAYDFSS